MLRRGRVTKKRRFFSLTACVLLILSSLLVGVSIQTPNVAAFPQNHDVGNVDIKMLTAFGRILGSITWKGQYQTLYDPMAGGGPIGLVIDHDNYIHTPGSEDIADSFGSYTYSSADDLKEVNPVTLFDDGITEKSIASFQNKGAGYPDDILINQTAWTALDKDWAIIQWSLLNIKGVPLTDVRIGLELPLSFAGKKGVGGDGGDDIDGFDATNNTYWAQDDGGTTIGFASAITTEPITHYYSENGSIFASFDEYKYTYENETWLYERINGSNQVVGTTPGNRISTVGWDGFDMGIGSINTFTLVIAVNDSFDNMTAAVQDAQYYYDYVAAGFRITEFNDFDSGSGNQYIEVYNYGQATTDLYAAGYRLSVDGGSSFLLGDSLDWSPNPLPTYDYGIFTLDATENIPAEGGTIGLYYDDGGGYILIDEVSYGQKGLAPDPADGESVARRYDASMAVYTNEWLRNGSTGTTFGAPNNVGSVIFSPKVVLNRVMFNPLHVAEGYVELIRRRGSMIDISGYRIVCDNEFIVPPGTVLNSSNIFYVLNQSSSPQFFLNMSDVADNIYLYDNNDNLLDMVGWSSSHSQGYFMSRVPDGDGTFKGFNDSTSQTAGWVFDQSYQLLSLQITEFYADTTSIQIEVYNLRGGDKVLDSLPPRLTFDVDNGPLTGTWAQTTILANGGYSIFTMDVAGGNPGEEGDTISLYYDPGSGWILIDEVSFGTNGVAPDPVIGESTARYWDDSILGYSNDWTRNASTGPTWGSQNDVGNIISPNVLINRVEFNPWDTAEAYVELMWTGGATNIAGYKIVCDDAYVIPAGTSLGTSNRFFVLNQSNFPANFNMDSSADNVYLYDENDNLLDMVGWSSAHDQGTFMSRIPDGNGTYQGFNDTTSLAAGWVFNQQPTLQITEFYADSSNADIEIYNPRGGDIVPTNGHWRLDVNAGTLTGGSWSPVTIPANRGYSTYTMGAGNPGDEGDIISLFYDPGSGWILMDQVGYGTNGPAPDPLAAESVGRYWDGAAYAYTNDWNRNASSGPTWNDQNDVPAVNNTPWLILDDVMFYPSLIPDGRYIIVICTAPTGWMINLQNRYIVCDGVYQFPDVIYWMDPGDRIIIDYTNAPALFDSMDEPEDTVYLYDSNGVLYDMVGWNTLHLQGMSVSRIPMGTGTYQGHDDTTSEAAGWVFNNPLQVIMTEISDSETAPQAQIEVYNPYYPIIDFDAGNVFTFNSSSSGGELSGTWMISTADTGEYVVFNVTSGLDWEGDTISFYQNGYLIDEIGYGQNGVVPDPLKDESVERYWNGAVYTDVWERNYITGPNFGSQNDVPPANLSSSIILNEVLFYPNASADALVEIYNIGGAPINISGYKIVCDTEYIIPDGTWLDFNERFFYLLQGMDPGFFDPVNMSSTGDNVYLYDANGSLVDMVGWNSQHTQGSSVCRVPDGNGTRDGYDDVSSVAAGWQFDCTPTVHLISIDTLDGVKPIEFGHFNSTVIFNLTITNLQDISDIIDILNISQEGWIVEIYDETGTVKITSVTLNPDESINIIVNVTLPSTFPFIAVDNITITIRSSNSQIIGDFIILTAKVYPFLNLTKTATPYEIYMNGTGHDEIATVTLNLTGLGARVANRRYLDCVFCIDSSGSMGGNDPTGLRITESQNFVANHFAFPDRAAVVDFDTVATLLPFSEPDGDHLSSNYAKIIANFMDINSEGGTSVSAGLNLSNEELRFHGDPINQTMIIILLTDARTSDEAGCINEANIAASRGVIIFTIGLTVSPGSPMEDLLKNIANITGGQYYPAPTAQNFTAIYENISQILNDIAVWDDNTADPDPMVRDVLPPGVELVGNFSIPPDNVYVDPVTNETIIEWNLDWIKLGETFSVSFDIKSNIPGRVYTNVYNKSRAYYTRWDNTTDTVYFPLTWIFVIPPAPFPPKLYINITPNKDDIRLYWDEPLSPGTDHYLIYRAQDPRGFNFLSPWVNTSSDIDLLDPSGTQWPERRTWNHTGAADPLDLVEYAEQWYYCIRSVNPVGDRSYTSRTVGKWTREFTLGGVSTFSLPLEPLAIMNTSADFYLTDMNADYIKWMDPGLHVWNKHGDGGVNDTQLEVGKGYEVKFGSPAKFTFMGMPGAMTRYNSGSYLGFDYNFEARDLTASVNPATGDITLTWSAPSNPGTVQYHVYYSTTRDGFHGTRGVDYTLLAALPVGTLTTTHFGVALQNTQYYYMVIPLNATDAEGATTYSIGVWTSNYLAEYDTLGIPLILDSYQTADWYCDMGNVVGINYFIDSSQRWLWHSTRMPQGAFDPTLMMTEGYQISTSAGTKYSFVGI